MTEACLALQVYALTLQDINVRHKGTNFYCLFGSRFVVITELPHMVLYL